MLGPFQPTKHPQISLDLTVPSQTPWLFSESYKVIHGPNGLWLVQLISIILSWIYAVHFKCSWTCMDPSSPPNTPKSSWIWQCPQKHHGCFQPDLVMHGPNVCALCNSSVSFLYGSILSISTVAWHAWTLPAHQTTPTHPWSGSAHTNTMAFFREL
jgi:hypothetical protein